MLSDPIHKLSSIIGVQLDEIGPGHLALQQLGFEDQLRKVQYRGTLTGPSGGVITVEQGRDHRVVEIEIDANNQAIRDWNDQIIAVFGADISGRKEYREQDIKSYSRTWQLGNISIHLRHRKPIFKSIFSIQAIKYS